jgi:hypothetical protein
VIFLVHRYITILRRSIMKEEKSEMEEESGIEPALQI